MPAIDDTPIYNLKAVVHETGLKPDTLRAWERRYGLPEPDRTRGGHRLYSQRDIETLKWLIARQDEGLSISRAVELWHTLRHEGRDPLTLPEYASEVRTPARTPISLAGGETLTDLRNAWLNACLDFNGHLAESILVQAFAFYPPEMVCFEVLQKGLSQIGEGWYEGEMTVQQEHFASALAMRRLESLVAAAAPPTRQGRTLIGCPPGEDHTFSTLLLTLVLRRHGYDVVYLGANVPVEHLEHAIKVAHPNLVIMAAQQLYTASTLLDVAELLHQIRIPLAFGGRAFSEIPGLAERIPGHYLGDGLESVADAVERLLVTRGPAEAAVRPSNEYLRTFRAFREARPSIEAAVRVGLEQHSINPGHLSSANLNFSQNVEAALRLGDLDALRPDLAWIRGLLLTRQLPEAFLYDYLRVYRDAVEAEVDEGCERLVAWLDAVITHGLDGKQS
jgi:DNA-binding transcriptional MerR regulator/cobalamin-dependent methionine synthase I